MVDRVVLHNRLLLFSNNVGHLAVEFVGNFIQEQQILDALAAFFGEHALEAPIRFGRERVAFGFAFERINALEKIVGERARIVLIEIFFIREVRAANVRIDDNL